MSTKKLSFILYDGIENSIFTSQVLQFIFNLLEENKKLEIFLISFEKKRLKNTTIKNLIPAHNRLHLILAKKISFYGKTSLNIATYQLIKILKHIKTEGFIARGPLAGYVTIKAINKTLNQKEKTENNIKLLIQARGLCAEEFRFFRESNKHNFIIEKINKHIYKQLNAIEKEVYQKNNKLPFKKTIESVSPALKEYLVLNFNAAKSNIILAKKDIPKNIDDENKKKWRKLIRKNLNIKDDQTVFCYSGSYKPWQCIPETIDYFSAQLKKNPKSFLLLLTPDTKKLAFFLKNKNISNKNFALINVKPKYLHKYIAAGDFGLLFRKKDIINWVARPTKMLEYKAAGLKIIHNKTIKWLEN